MDPSKAPSAASPFDLALPPLPKATPIKFSVIVLAAYDHAMLHECMPSWYDVADEVLIAIDKDRLTWSKNPFDLDLPSFRRQIASIDHRNIARIVEGDYHQLDHPFANEIACRNYMSTLAKPGNMILQVDVDEYFLNARMFRDTLESHTIPTFSNPKPFVATHCIFGRWVSVYKRFGDEVLVVEPAGEPVPLATMARNSYRQGRITDQPGVVVGADVLHFSWARSPQELKQKLDNWGHARDFDPSPHFAKWEACTPENHQSEAYRNFHPMGDGKTWQRLVRHSLTRGPAPAQ